jgi:peptidoglycan/LPS O-acetylase OafA/YrhL
MLDKYTKEVVATRLDFIDSLRGFAALYVVLFHMVLVPIHKLIIPPYLKGFVLSGGSGVTLFFIISAFTLCYTLDSMKNNKNYLLHFYTRRFFRIFPLYFLWLILVLFIYGLPKFKYFLLYLTFTFNFFPYHQEGIVWASWTLGIEVIFYLVFPLIFKYVSNIKKAFYLFIVSLILMTIHYYYTKNINGYKVSIGILNQLPVFTIGILLYYLYKNNKYVEYNKKLGYCLIGISLFLFYFFSQLFGWLSYASFLAKAFSYSILFLGLFICPVKVFVNKVSIFFGKISYSLYLNHPRMVFAMTILYSQFEKLLNCQGAALLISFLATLIILVPISYFTYSFIEKPCIIFAKRFLEHKK